MNMLPAVSVRHNRLDASVVPIVSIGRARPDLQTVPPTGPRTSAQILAEGEQARLECDALLASRPNMLLIGSTEEVAALDARIELARVRMLQANIQHVAALVAEAEAKAEHETEQKRRKDLHRKATKAGAEVPKLADQYVAEAQRLVPLLAKIREQAWLIEVANSALPDGADPVPTGEPRCSWEGRLDQPHNSIANRVRLPALGTDAGYIWGEVAQIYGRIINDSH